MSSAFAKRDHGFTLIELLTVVAIIVVLAAILIPTAGKAMQSARKAKASSNLRQIALAYTLYINAESNPKTINTAKLSEWAAELAKKVDFNNPSIWILKDDPLVAQAPAKYPQTIVSLANEASGEWVIDENFKDFPLSFAVASGLSLYAPQSTTPIAWTRGLKATGKWASLDEANPGVYGDAGGHIAFLDGHVSWYAEVNKSNNALLHYMTRKPTSNIFKALSPNASILDCKGKAASNTPF